VKLLGRVLLAVDAPGVDRGAQLFELAGGFAQVTTGENGIDGLAQGFDAGLGTEGVGVHRAAGGEQDVVAQVVNDDFGGTRMDAAADLGEGGLEVVERRLQGDQGFEIFLRCIELHAVGSGVGGDIGAAQAGELAEGEVGAHAQVGGFGVGAEEIGVDVDGQVDLRGGQILDGAQAGSEVADHEHVGAGVEGSAGVGEDVFGRVGDVNGVVGVVTGLLEGTPFGCQADFDALDDGGVAGVGGLFVVFDHVGAAESHLEEEVAGLLGGETDAGLDDAADQGAVMDAELLADLLHAETGAGELLDVLAGKVDVDKLNVTEEGYNTDQGVHQHGELVTEVQEGEGNLDDEGNFFVGGGIFVVGDLKDFDDLSAVTADQLGGFEGQVDPASGRFLDGQVGGELHVVGRLGFDNVGADDVVIGVNGFGDGKEEGIEGGH